MTEEDDRLEKVFVDLPNHWGTSGESMWAIKLDCDLYQIDNVPFYAYGLNYRDKVQTDSTDSTRKPIVKKVVEASGHETIRVLFSKGVGEKKQVPIIDELGRMGVEIERAFEKYVALDIPPETDYDAVRNKLDDFQGKDILQYETCEARIDGGFDNSPNDNDENSTLSN